MSAFGLLAQASLWAPLGTQIALLPPQPSWRPSLCSLWGVSGCPRSWREGGRCTSSPVRLTCKALACILSQDRSLLADGTNAHFSFSELGGPCLMTSKWTTALSTIVQYQFIPLEPQEGGVCLMFCSKGFPKINSLLLRSILVSIPFWTKTVCIKALTIKVLKKP